MYHLHLHLCTTPFKLESYLEALKERVDAHMERYRAQRRFGHMPWERHLERADHYAGRILATEERLRELLSKKTA